MRFVLLDRVLELESGVKIVAQKNLSLAEEYLADHFPNAPVMPGVLMLESLTEAAAWLIRESENFAHSLVLLKEARNVKYANFVEPGKSLLVTAEMQSQDERETRLKAQGTIDGIVAVSARLMMQRSNLAEVDPSRAATDAFIVARLREQFSLIHRAVGIQPSG